MNKIPYGLITKKSFESLIKSGAFDVIERKSEWIYAKEADHLVTTGLASALSSLGTNTATFAKVFIFQGSVSAFCECSECRENAPLVNKNTHNLLIKL